MVQVVQSEQEDLKGPLERQSGLILVVATCLHVSITTTGLTREIRSGDVDADPETISIRNFSRSSLVIAGNSEDNMKPE